MANQFNYELTNSICYGNGVYYPCIDLPIGHVTTQNIHDLFHNNKEFEPTTQIEHYYYGIYENKKQNYKKMKMYYRNPIHNNWTKATSTWMLAKYYHVTKENFEKAKLHYLSIYQLLHNDCDFLEIILGVGHRYGYSNEQMKEVQNLMFERAESGCPYACYLYSYSKLESGECDYNEICAYLLAASKSNIKTLPYVWATFYGSQNSYINDYYNIAEAEKYYLESINNNLKIPDSNEGGYINIRYEYVEFLCHTEQWVKALHKFDEYYDEADPKNDMPIRHIINMIDDICRLDCKASENNIIIEDPESIITIDNKDEVFGLIEKILVNVCITDYQLPIGLVLLKEAFKRSLPNTTLEIII